MLASDFPSSQVTTTAGAGCRSVLVWQFPHLAAKLADREASTQGSSSSNSATNARSYLSQYMTDLQLPVQCTAAEYWQQKLVLLLSHWWYRMLFLLQHHRLSLKDFSQFVVCWLKALVIVWKKIFVHESVAKSELWWTQWHAVECRLAGFDYLNYRLCVGNWV